MGAVDRFLTHGIRLELAADDNIRAIGTLNEMLRAAIKTQKPQLIHELQWREFESLLAIVAPAHNTPAHELDAIREAAKSDFLAALVAYRAMAKHVKGN